MSTTPTVAAGLSPSVTASSNSLTESSPAQAGKPPTSGFIIGPVADSFLIIGAPLVALAIAGPLFALPASRFGVSLHGMPYDWRQILIVAFINAHLFLVFFRSHGEMANLCQMIEANSTETGHGPAWIVLEVQRGRIANLNTFIRDVRREEGKWAELPGFTITRPTHLSRIAGNEQVEFEFVKDPQHLVARQVYLRTDTCVLHFLLNTERESDLPRFEQFLNSIRLE